VTREEDVAGSEEHGVRGGGKPDEDKPAGGLASRAMPQLNDLYREVVLDHYRNPRGRKRLDHPNVNVEGFNPACGDQVHVALAIEGERIREVEVECQGCSISVASGSMMAELLVGKTRQEVVELAEGFKATMHGREIEPGVDLGDLEALQGVRQFPVRIKCALLAWTTVQEALAAFSKERIPGKNESPAGDEESRDADRK
jgi:nitrogen fixation protein NifU and related proteins